MTNVSKAGSPARRRGVFSAQMLREAIRDGIIRSVREIDAGQVQPASLDLRLGSRAYRLRSSFLPGDARVQDRLADLQVGPEIDLDDPTGAVLDPGHPYLIPLAETLRLPPDTRARANPRSSTGRLDIFTRVIADRGSQFDEVEAGYEGPLWLEVYSSTFTIAVRAGLALAQLRLSNALDALAADEIRALHQTEGLLFAPGADPRERVSQPAIGSRGLLVSVGLPSGDQHIGWRARHHTRLLDLSKTNEYDALDFWEPVRAEAGGRLVLGPNDFYLLISKEFVRIPPGVAAEMVAYDPTNGELRTHYAGFFDPGFGYGPSLHGTRAVLEVRAHDVPFMLEDGQPIARLAYEYMAEEPDRLYGDPESGSHFQRQGISLSRQFRPVAGTITFQFLTD
ncbi:MAG: 2'-deoxycytidine 5'-triphosphate deaminase [Dehalococcoidia bacterium]